MTFKQWLKPSKGVNRLFIAITTAIVSVVVWGCSTTSLIPTRVNPIVGLVMEGETPNWQGWTFQGLEDLRVDYLEMMYPIIIETHDYQRSASEKIGQTILGLLAATGLAGTGALPIVAKMVPKTAIKKEDHDKLVAEAGMKDPAEFAKEKA